GRGDDLPVRMPERCARRLAMVLEDHHSLKPRVAHQVEIARLGHAQDELNLLDRLLGQRTAVVGRLDDDFMRAAAADIPKPVAVVRVVFFDTQRGEFIGDDAYAPLRRTGPRRSNTADFFRSGGFVTGTERAGRLELRRYWGDAVPAAQFVRAPGA